MFHRPPPELTLTCIRGVRAGAAAPDGLTDVQASTIAAMAAQVFAMPVDPGALEPIGPDELAVAVAVADPALRHQLVVAMLALSLMAHPPDPAGPDRIEVVMDGGIRRGSDVVKALALGARAVMIGRAYLWGLAANGERGVQNVLSVLRQGIDSALLGLGKSSVHELDRSDVLVPPDFARDWS